MKPYRYTTATLVLMGLLLAPGCPNGSGAATLTPEQQAAIDAVVAQLEASAKALGGLVDGFAGIDAGSDTTFGDCPVVDVTFVDGVTTIVLDYGDGCGNAYYGDSPASGSITTTFDVASRAFAVTFDSFSVDEHTVTGTLSLHRESEGLGVVTFVGSIDIDISGVGSTQGSITLSFEVDEATITIEDAALTLSGEDGSEFAVTATDLVIRPVANGSFIPESGTVSFEMSDDGSGSDTVTIMITFGAQSPVDGTVSVEVGGSPSIEYALSSAG